MIRAARQGKRVVRLKGGDPFVFGRGAEEALALAHGGHPVRGRARRDDGGCGAGAGRHSGHAPRRGVGVPRDGRSRRARRSTRRSAAVQPNSVTLVVMMGLAGRDEIAARLIAHGWPPSTPAAIVCGASTPDAWTWTGTAGGDWSGARRRTAWPACWSSAKWFRFVKRWPDGAGQRRPGAAMRTR